MSISNAMREGHYRKKNGERPLTPKQIKRLKKKAGREKDVEREAVD